MAEFLPLLGVIGASVAASVGTALLGAWIGGKEMEAYTRQMVRLYVNMMVPMMVLQLIAGLLYVPFQMFMYMRW